MFDLYEVGTMGNLFSLHVRFKLSSNSQVL